MIMDSTKNNHLLGLLCFVANRAQTSYRRLLVIIVRDVQHLAARLAVDSIRIMTLQPALGAREEHLAAGAEHSLCQA
jgi:hypothetical protein